MSELRAPDPTLTARARQRGGGAWEVAIIDEWRAVPVAHDVVFHYATGSGEDYVPAHRTLRCDSTCTAYEHNSHLSRHARWYARPCLRCFPDAPPPGQRFIDLDDPDDVYGTDGREGSTVVHPNLAWQVPS